jgi:hypothetical protein
MTPSYVAYLMDCDRIRDFAPDRRDENLFGLKNGMSCDGRLQL